MLYLEMPGPQRKAKGKEETKDGALNEEKKIEEAEHQEGFFPPPEMTQWRNNSSIKRI